MMKLTVNTATLSNEQMKFLSQLGEFRGDKNERWVAGCSSEELAEAMGWLNWAGIHDVFVEFFPYSPSQPGSPDQ
jgi:hypothetical protein